MTQIVVNFLEQNGSVGSSTYATEPRIFDFEISPEAQAYYTYELTQILLGLKAAIKLPDGTLVAPTPSNLTFGTIVFFNASGEDSGAIAEAINRLNNWSKMRLVNPQGFQTYSYGAFDGSNSDPLVVPNTNGTPVPPVGAPTAPLMNPDDAAASGIAGVVTNGLTTTMDQYMAQGLDKLIRTLRSAGWDPVLDPAGTTATPQFFNQITDPSTTGIFNVASVLQQMLSAVTQAHVIGDAIGSDSDSIQQVLMVDYVSRGNEILFNEMGLLKDAIDLNQQALSYLNSLQDLMNQKDPQKFILQLQDLNNVSTNTVNPQSQYDKFEQDSYNQALSVFARVQADNEPALQAYLNSLSTGGTATSDDPLATGAFADLTTASQTLAAFSITTIKANLTYLVQQIGAKGGISGNGLVQALNTVYKDFNGLTGATPLQDWIQDVQKGDEGQFQRNLGSAIVSSQSFNDTQRENLREVMFVFEEFYKSATGLLSRLTQLLEKMADGIAR